VTNGIQSALELLKDTVHKIIVPQSGKRAAKPVVLFSQRADSLYKKMMYRSDNFFAEQILLMAANEKLQTMSDIKIIHEMLDHELKDLPQRPNWVDGSGLSRYNLFTPQDFVWMLKKMHAEFGLARLKEIFPGGGQGTLSDYYKADSGYIFAKTGSLMGTLALSGFLVTPKDKLLIFSVLVNNHQGSTTEVRRAIEIFLHNIRMKY
ncbi:MAG: D-alanyl-D-alanine carboxypeptidase, partial [Chitinophagaceae bacterium]